MPHCNRRRLVWAGLAALLSAPPAAAQAANAPKWKFDAGVSVSPLFKAYLDAPSCCNPIGGWATVGQGRFRLQMDYARNERQSLSYPTYYEEREGREIAVERAYLDEHVEQAAGAALYWRLLRHRRLTPHLLLGMSLARLADRPCIAEGLPCAGLPFRVLGEGSKAAGGVSVGTMRLAKGLEFRAVAVMACDDETIPLQERIEDVADEADLQEVYDTERHLLYVACTRARDYLWVSGVKPASEFLDDLRM